MQAPAAPLPPPIGTTITWMPGSCSSSSSVPVPTPEMSWRLVAGVDHPAAPLPGQVVAVHPRLVEVASVQDHLGAEAAHGGDLHRVRSFGRADRRVHAEQPGRVGDRLPMVPGRGAEHTRLALGPAELRDQVHSAADLERADRLMVLVLDEDLRPEQLVEQWVREERGRSQVGRDPAAGLEHVGEGRLFPLGHAASVSAADG